MSGSLKHFVMAAGVLALLLAACALIQPSGGSLVPGRAAVFSHAFHTGEELELDCEACHLPAEDSGRYLMPPLDVCALCHDAETDQDKPVERTPAGFAAASGDVARWTRATALSVEANFSHSVHTQAGVACGDCHEGIETSTAVESRVHVGMDDCMRCHAARAVDEGGCTGCHPALGAGDPPASHRASNWKGVHGQAWRHADERDPAQDCELCHGAEQALNSCQGCHSAVQPDDHTPTWKNRSHGIVALFRRDRCTACHQEDACLKCHATTRPVSHVAAWGSPSLNHCLSCHFGPSGGRNCAVCHLDGPVSHLLAPVPPVTVSEHATATTCLVCHNNIKKPRHPFTGDGGYCRRCHQ